MNDRRRPPRHRPDELLRGDASTGCVGRGPDHQLGCEFRASLPHEIERRRDDDAHNLNRGRRPGRRGVPGDPRASPRVRASARHRPARRRTPVPGRHVARRIPRLSTSRRTLSPRDVESCRQDLVWLRNPPTARISPSGPVGDRGDLRLLGAPPSLERIRSGTQAPYGDLKVDGQVFDQFVLPVKPLLQAVVDPRAHRTRRPCRCAPSTCW